ncbi:probable histidine kinase 6 isoform X2 [Nymphaea colorata]|uniref:probable histidine kinase 6 isoform X2 n=1 Tax=Nymphaea colorata TaxID=210225 RepID=UPI00129E15C4|nr:probable histidine kinase 6 isoform X2 [Nymphaea colorata]
MVAPSATKHRHALALRWCMRVEAKGAVKPWVSSPFKWLMGWILFFAVVSWLVYCYFYADAVTTRRESLAGMCDERARMLQDQFTVSVNHVHALAILVSSFHHRKSPSVLDQKTFAEYTAGTAFERPLLSGVAYAQKVVHAEREMFERNHGWTIKTMKREPSPVQDEYAPAIFSQETISYIESLDMMSGKEDRENIERARATGKAVLTSPFRLLESNKLGVILTFPVYGSSLPADATVKQRVQATVGYLGGAFDVESLVENLLWKLAGNEAIVVNVYDVTNCSMPLIMYGPQNPNGDMSLIHSSVLDFGDPFRKHLMTCRYLWKPSLPWTAIMSSSGVFVIGALIGYILYGAIIHIGKVEEDYNKMAELKVQAESADIAKSQFLATVSHEIRTPMNGVLGMLQMLLDTNLDSTQKDYARTAQASGKALITLINEVLDRAKIESGKFELEAVPFDLRSILDDVLSLFSGKSRDKGIELGVFVSDKVPEILIGDPGRFRQIITNLVGNSVKFTERGHIFVQVHLVDNAKSLMDGKVGASSRSGPTDLVVSSGNFFNTLSGFEAADERNSWETFKLLVSGPEISSDTLGECRAASGDVTLVVTVEDTGIGIPIHAQDHIFMPFMQADSSTSRTYGGTGIGLSISKCLVELMGGRINFISRPHIGSTFTFTAVLRRYDKDSVKGLKAPLVETVPMGFKGVKAIVVDARPVRAAVTTYHLQRLGMVVEIVNCMNMAIHSASGQNGYTINGLSGKKTDVILVEKESWCHEVENGFFGHLLECKQNGQALEMPKMVLLATSMNHVECAKAKAAGFADTLIMKPLRASMVAAGLQQVLGIGNIQPQGKGIPNGTPFLHNLLLGKNILVVDDNGINRRVAALALKKYGANVECAVSGKAALTMLQIPHKFDACFMDIQMPEMDGFEVTRQIRQLENQANEQIRNELTLHTGVRKVQWHLPILAMTADLIQATYEECLKCGMNGYVSKPFEKQQLYQAVAKFFEAKPIQDS